MHTTRRYRRTLWRGIITRLDALNFRQIGRSFDVSFAVERMDNANVLSMDYVARPAGPTVTTPDTVMTTGLRYLSGCVLTTTTRRPSVKPTRGRYDSWHEVCTHDTGPRTSSPSFHHADPTQPARPSPELHPCVRTTGVFLYALTPPHDDQGHRRPTDRRPATRRPHAGRPTPRRDTAATLRTGWGDPLPHWYAQPGRPSS